MKTKNHSEIKILTLGYTSGREIRLPPISDLNIWVSNYYPRELVSSQDKQWSRGKTGVRKDLAEEGKQEPGFEG